MDNETLEKIERYEELKHQIAEIEEEADEIKKELEEVLEPDTDYQGRYGKLSIQERKYYKYSDTVKEKKKEVKQLQDQEKAQGIAEETVSKTLYYRKNKTD